MCLTGLFSLDISGIAGLIAIGFLIVFVMRLLPVLIPATIAAFAVWYFTGDLWWTGLTFLVITVLSTLGRLL